MINGGSYLQNWPEFSSVLRYLNWVLVFRQLNGSKQKVEVEKWMKLLPPVGSPALKKAPSKEDLLCLLWGLVALVGGNFVGFATL